MANHDTKCFVCSRDLGFGYRSKRRVPSVAGWVLDALLRRTKRRTFLCYSCFCNAEDSVVVRAGK